MKMSPGYFSFCYIHVDRYLRRALAHGDDLLQGMLSADIVGFHAFDHARYVLSSTGKYWFALVNCVYRVANTGSKCYDSVSK